MSKQFWLGAEEIRPLVTGHGACIASDKITVDGFPVLFMYREEPDNEVDGGWRFMSGFESDEYMSEASNFALYDVNTIANYDQSIIPFLSYPIGSVFERGEVKENFVAVTDWKPGDE